MKQHKRVLAAALTCAAVLVIMFTLFRFLYVYDNKYTSGAPYGSNGVFSFTESDLQKPIFLIDGWKYSANGTEEAETFIGQYSNFSYPSGESPFGQATYRLALRCPGAHALALEIPEIFTDYVLYLDDEFQGYIMLIEGENNDIRQRVESLSTLNSFDRITAPREEIDIDTLLLDVEKQNAPEVGVCGIHFSVDYLGQQVTILGQREKLMMMFENLIYNSISFTPENGSISIATHIAENYVLIEVSDTGSGIDAEHLPHIFERFYSVRSNKNEGSGLGLYIAHLTVQELGGNITAESAPGSGTVMRISLPFFQK